MPRPTISVDKDTLEQVIKECEDKKTYRNHSELWKDVANTYSTKTNVNISPALVYLRVNEFGIIVNTPKGRKGRQLGDAPITRGPRVNRATKFAQNAVACQSLALLEAEVKREQNGRFLPVVRKLKEGSITAAIKLKCLDCTAYQVEEIKHCPCNNCPLYLIRPYREKSS